MLDLLLSFALTRGGTTIAAEVVAPLLRPFNARLLRGGVGGR